MQSIEIREWLAYSLNLIGISSFFLDFYRLILQHKNKKN